MLWIIMALIILGGIVIYLAIPGGRLWKQYLSDIRDSMSALRNGSRALGSFSEAAIASLPDLLRKHITNGGYLNHSMMDNMLIRFPNAKFRMSAGKKPINIKFMQVNFVTRPDRHAFLTGRMAGIPIHAKDSVMNGHGSMTGMLAKQFRLFHSTGSEMDQGQLITALADAVYMPALFLQSFITWKECDEHSVEGTISWKGVTVQGIFTFDQDGNIIRFDTNDRYMDENGKGSSLVPWRVTYSDYREQNGYYQPGSVQVSWILPDGDDIYFMSNCIDITYTVSESDL